MDAPPLKKQKHAILHNVIDIEDDDHDLIDGKVCKSDKGKKVEAIHHVLHVPHYNFSHPGMKYFGSAIFHDVIDIDDDDDDDDDDYKNLVKIDEKVGKSNKGKIVEAINQEVSDYRFCKLGVENFGPKEVGNNSSYHANIKEEIPRKSRSFKQFDVVNDASDHHFVNKKSPMKQNPKDWANAILKDWEILKNDLPEAIFVRVYESRMDLLRAVIIGAEGTIYHNGVFFFDLYFPDSYPISPPLVYFHSRGDWLNRYLLPSGEVSLSLLHTSSGSGSELWLPRISTTLQVLVSIQGLILTESQFFKEHVSKPHPDWAKNTCQKHNKINIFTKSLSLMENMIRLPPKNFEDFVADHFINHAHDIMVACNAYMEEDVKVEQMKVADDPIFAKLFGNIPIHHDITTKSSKDSVQEFYNNLLVERIRALVKEFIRIGVKDCEKFLNKDKTTTLSNLDLVIW